MNHNAGSWPVIAPEVCARRRAHAAPGWCRLTSPDSKSTAPSYHPVEPIVSELTRLIAWARSEARAIIQAERAEAKRQARVFAREREKATRALISRQRQEARRMEREAHKLSPEERERRRQEGWERWRAAQPNREPRPPKPRKSRAKAIEIPRGYLPLREAAGKVGVLSSRLSAAITQGELKARRIRNRVFIPHASLAAWRRRHPPRRRAA